MTKKKFRITTLIISVFFMLSAVGLLLGATDYGATVTYADYDGVHIPSAYALVGTENLPPIDDQCEIGCCSSEAAAYMQFTNAVSKYIHENDNGAEWNPSSGDGRYIFSPKFTYVHGGSGVDNVYTILTDHGCAFLSQSTFVKTSEGGNIYQKNGELISSSVSWDIANNTSTPITDSVGFNALKYRLTGYEHIEINKTPYIDNSQVNGQTNIKFTTSEEGRALMVKIKDALNRGNVVCASTIPDKWDFDTVENGGTLGQAGQSVIVSAHIDASGTAGSHSISIVGYDDNLKTVCHGVEMTGAFLIANSWGVGWGNAGYVWMMYDALNTVSEYEGLGAYSENRSWPIFQFWFTYWDRDISVSEMPDRILKVNITAKNRENPYIVLTMRDNETGKITEHIPGVFYTGYDWNGHPDYGIISDIKWLTFSGTKNGAYDETRTFYFSYQNLIDLIPEGKTAGDYTFGARFVSVREGKVTYSAISLIDGEGYTLQRKTDAISCESVGENGKTFGGSVAFADVERHSVKVTDGEGYFFNYKSDSVEHGDKFEFTLSAISGYDLGNAVVKVNSVSVLPSGGKYTIEKVTKDIEITATGVVKSSLNPETVNFYVDGDIYDSQNYGVGDKIILPTEPEKEGYNFVGWAADYDNREFYCLDSSFPEYMPAYSFNAYAKFEIAKTATKINGGKYGAHGFENEYGATVLLFTADCSPSIYRDLWLNNGRYEWVLNYSWTAGGINYNFIQGNILPASYYDFDGAVLFRFKVCEFSDPFVPTVNQVYKISLTVKTDDTVYEISGDSNGYYIQEEPICREAETKVATAGHFFEEDNDFEYWSGKTYMTLDFKGVDTSVGKGNYLWRLYITGGKENRSAYAYYPNSFYEMSSVEFLVRFPVLEFGFIPEYDGEYSIDFEVYDGNALLYTATLSDVKCKLKYSVTWKVQGKEDYVTECAVGETPNYGSTVSYETLSEKYDHISWDTPVKKATAPCTYISVGDYVAYDYVVRFFVDGEIISEKGYASGTTAIRPSDPVKVGYTFNGWWDEDYFDEYDFASPITGNIDLYADFTIIKYTVSYDTDGGSAVNSQVVSYGKRATRPINDPTKTGYTFNGWHEDEDYMFEYDFDSPVTKSITIYAEFKINKYTVSYDTDGGSAVNSQVVSHGNKATRPINDPTKTGYTFNGWYENANYTFEYDFDSPVTENVTVYAEFKINKYTVTFMADGTTYGTVKVKYQGKVAKPVNPTKYKHTFGGWYKDEACVEEFDFNDEVITDNTTIYAKFTKEVYTVTFIADGVTYDTAKVEYQGKATKPADPTKEKHSFGGWYTGTDFETEFDFNGEIAEDITLYAEFNEYEMKFGEFVWSGYTARAKYITEADDEYVEYYDAVVTSEITKEATCQEEGEKTYTAVYGDLTDTKTEVIAKKSHELSGWITDKEATETEEGLRHKECTQCGEIVKEEKINKLRTNKGCLGEINGSSVAPCFAVALLTVIFLNKRRRNDK